MSLIAKEDDDEGDGILDGWYNLEYHEPPKPFIKGKIKIIPWVVVYDEPTGNKVPAWWRSDGWLYDSALPRSPNNKWWTHEKSSEELDRKFIKERCPYHKKD